MVHMGLDKTHEMRFGDVDDVRCKQNSFKPIDRKTCKNNCHFWSGKCDLGYNASLIKL